MLDGAHRADIAVGFLFISGFNAGADEPVQHNKIGIICYDGLLAPEERH